MREASAFAPDPLLRYGGLRGQEQAAAALRRCRLPPIYRLSSFADGCSRRWFFFDTAAPTSWAHDDSADEPGISRRNAHSAEEGIIAAGAIELLAAAGDASHPLAFRWRAVDHRQRSGGAASLGGWRRWALDRLPPTIPTRCACGALGVEESKAQAHSPAGKGDGADSQSAVRRPALCGSDARRCI